MQESLRSWRLVGRFGLLGVLLARWVICLKCGEVSMRCKMAKEVMSSASHASMRFKGIK